MGGEQFGGEASLLAAKALAGISAAEFSRRSGALLAQINEKICALMRREKARIGTTFAGLWISQGRAGAVNLGDSRIYRLPGRQAGTAQPGPHPAAAAFGYGTDRPAARRPAIRIAIA